MTTFRRSIRSRYPWWTLLLLPVPALLYARIAPRLQPALRRQRTR
jgi:hypothetical protein